VDAYLGRLLDGTYRLDKLLGQGGMGAVFCARDSRLERDVAIKLMHPHLAAQTGFRERFLQEARAVARLTHPGIVRVYAFGPGPETLYLVMELLAGASLRNWLALLREEAQVAGVEDSLALGIEIANALDYAHQQGVFHRDIKPGNILLCPLPPEERVPGGLSFRPVVTDFGLAKLAAGGIQSLTGTTVGTPAYMAPEQCEGAPIDGRADVYSLGIVLYELLTGRPPFEVSTITEAIRAHTRTAPPPPRTLTPDLPSQVEQAVLTALAKAPDDRFQTAHQMADALRSAMLALETAQAEPSAGASSLSALVLTRPAPQGAATDAEPTPSEPALARWLLTLADAQGATQSVALPNGRHTIGRSESCDITLDEKRVSRTHAEVLVEGDRVTLVDRNSTNGTYRDGVRLVPGMPEVWRASHTVRIGGSALRLSPVGGAPGLQATAPPESAGPRDVVTPTTGLDAIQAELVPTSVSLAPDERAEMRVRALNAQRHVEHLLLTVEGLPAAWVELPRDPLPLLPGEQGELTLTLCPKDVGERGGPQAFQVRLASRDHPGTAVTLAATLVLPKPPTRSIDLSLDPRRLAPGKAATVTVRNTGETQETIELAVAAREAAVKGACQPDRLALQPGQTATSSLQVTWDGSPPTRDTDLPLAVRACAQDRELARAEGTLRLTAPSPPKPAPRPAPRPQKPAPEPQPEPREKAGCGTWLAQLLVLLLGLAVTGGAAWLAGLFVYEQVIREDAAAWIALAAVGLVGLVLTIRTVRRIGR